MLKVANSVINASQIATPIILSGDVTLSTGNLVIGTSGKGIDFSATSHPAGMTSELLNDYEEGTYTPTVTSSSGSFTTVSATGRYTKIGRAVTVNVLITITNNGTAATNILYTLPFAAAFESVGCGREMDSTGDMVSTAVAPSLPSTANIQKYNNTYPGGTGFKIQLTMTYIV